MDILATFQFKNGPYFPQHILNGFLMSHLVISDRCPKTGASIAATEFLSRIGINQIAARGFC
jgi:hypothetical protein